MVRALMCVFAAMAATVGLAEPTSFIFGDVRVQVLSPSLVRIEQKGPRGFEDRKTFTVVNRSWPGAQTRLVNSKAGPMVVTPRYTVFVTALRKGLEGVKVTPRNGAESTTLKAPWTGQTYLPSPSALPGTYVMADAPRMVPPPLGATPIPLSPSDPLAATSGYDTRNNAPDVYVFVPKSYTKFRSEYLKLTGPVPMVPRFTFGFWDSRWFPYTEKQALDTIDTYRKKGIPLDLFTADTDWRIGGSDGYKPDPKYFPDMPGFLAKAHARGVKVMFNDHPEPKFPTALDPRETAYRYESLTSVLKMGLDVWWFDRNWWTSFREPMPGIHKEVWGQAIFHDATARFRPGSRPMIMSNVEGIDNGRRNGPPHPAGHRYPIMWTGDTGSTFEFLKYGIENGVDAGIYGLLPYVNEDLGGHTGNPTDELYVRYLQFGALSPVTRVHCTLNKVRYPWAYSPKAEKLVTDSIKFRYRLVPTLYAAARQAYEDGTPILRRLDLYYPKQKEAANNHQYLLGEDLLVAPVYQSENSTGQPIVGLLRTESDQPGLSAEYFGNEKLSGEPVLKRVDSNVRFDWGEGSPAPAVPADHFSARWTGLIGPMPKTATYRFGVTADDGVRLWINDKQLINEWHANDSVTYTGDVTLEAGKSYPIRLEFLEIEGGAKCLLQWYPKEDHPAGQAKSSLWVPPGKWHDVWTGKTLVGPTTLNRYAPLEMVPMLVRDGAIILGGPDVQATAQQRGRAVTADVFPPEEGSKVMRTFYEDDGSSVDYANGKFVKRNLTATTRPGRFEVQLAPSTGSYAGQPKARGWTLRFHLAAGTLVKSVRVNGIPMPVDGKSIRLERPTGAPKTILGVLDATFAPVLVVNLPKVNEKDGAIVRVNLR